MVQNAVLKKYLTENFNSALLTFVEEEVKNQKSEQSSYKKNFVSSAYKKRPLWKLILIYALVGGVIYALIYYFVFYKKGKSYSSGQNQSYSQPTDVPVVTKTPNGLMEEAAVNLAKSGFTPQTLTVKAGTKVIWTNESGKEATVNSANHPTHQVYPPLNLGEFEDGENLSLIFNTPGTYRYHNHLNTTVFGSVIVE